MAGHEPVAQLPDTAQEQQMTDTGAPKAVEHPGGIGDVALATARRIRDAVSRVVMGKDAVIDLALTVLLADGHLLLEDVPGLGKTQLAKSLAATLGGVFARIQFTPDLLPSDVTGVSVFDPRTADFHFRPGPIFANVVLADEINRASAKTQAALLECMAERQVTVDGTTHRLERPFLVIATANPIEMTGTYALPEAQRDRFMARIPVGYPDHAAEMRMLAEHTGSDPVAAMRPVAGPQEIATMFAAVGQVHVSDPIRDLAVTIATLTRNNPDIRLGASPRATLHLVRAAKSAALLAGRDFVVRDDVLRMAPTVLGHRLILAGSAGVGRSGDQVVTELLARVPRMRR
jgi:MoxR-like ATPase